MPQYCSALNILHDSISNNSSKNAQQSRIESANRLSDDNKHITNQFLSLTFCMESGCAIPRTYGIDFVQIKTINHTLVCRVNEYLIQYFPFGLVALDSFQFIVMGNRNSTNKQK